MFYFILLLPRDTIALQAATDKPPSRFDYSILGLLNATETCGNFTESTHKSPHSVLQLQVCHKSIPLSGPKSMKRRARISRLRLNREQKKELKNRKKPAKYEIMSSDLYHLRSVLMLTLNE
jgi:hypothetical protein